MKVSILIDIARMVFATTSASAPLSSAALTQAPRETRLVLTTLAALAHAATAPASAAGVTALRAEGFRLVRAPGEPATWWLVGADAAGAMYAALEAAELIRGGGAAALRETEQAPAVAERGIKFNLPLDARSPSYSDASDSAQQNIATVWDLAFSRELIDRLARDRYNLVSLWNLHPFPSLVRVPEYPDVALADVLRSRVAWRENYALQATGLDAPEILGPVETLRHLTIDEKIEFWRAVMRSGSIAFRP